MKNPYEQELLIEAGILNFPAGQTYRGKVTWESPSNIAIVKYWGKKPVQIPSNASLSVTLDAARTRMSVAYEYHRSIQGPRLNFRFEGKPAEAFSERIGKYLNQVQVFLPWLSNTSLEIDSSNTFPHSSGIASSASAMSALAMCLTEIDATITGSDPGHPDLRKASFLARLGSGSAARSVYPSAAAWGETAAIQGSTDEYAVPVTSIHKDFKEMQDSILIIESGKKQVSSSLGHSLMDGNPFAEARFAQAERNMQELKGILETGDWGRFIDLMENEALTLHAMMMTGKPGYILMQPGTIEAIRLIREQRKNTGMKIGFTLDAGANVHILYPKADSEMTRHFIDSQLVLLCEDGRIIHDQMGNGPVKVA